MPLRGEHIRRVLVVACVVSLLGVSQAAAAPSVLPQRGDRSPNVVRVQRLLVAAGISVPGGADGRFGAGTTKAVATFQTSKGLRSTGTLDAASAVALGFSPPTPLLGPGAAGAGVRALQAALQTAGMKVTGGPDGVYGTATTRAVAAFQTSKGIRPTGAADAYTMALVAAAAKPVPPPPRRLTAFPVPRTCSFWDTWGAPRFGGRHHQGVDVFARLGTPIYAVETGYISDIRADRPGSIGGNQVWVTTRDRTRYFYGHLNNFAKGIRRGVPVRAGQVIGYVGKTGLTTVTHLHFEWHPLGGAAVNPYSTLRLTASC